jgi:hypothetical protein
MASSLSFQGEGCGLDLSLDAVESADLKHQVCGAVLLERDNQGEGLRWHGRTVFGGGLKDPRPLHQRHLARFLISMA